MDYRQNFEFPKGNTYQSPPIKGWEDAHLAIEEASSYLITPYGFCSLLMAAPEVSDGVRQKSFRISQLPKKLPLIDPSRDTWISQNTFWTYRRRLVNLMSMGMLFLDVDIYKSKIAYPGWREGGNFDDLATAFLWFCDWESVPPPSLIMFSGRGIQPKWLFDKPLPRSALPRWNCAERVLLGKFLDYGADPGAKDACRVLRVAGTYNSKSGKKCEEIYRHEIGGSLIRYKFEHLCEAILPFSRKEIQERRTQRSVITAPHERKIIVPGSEPDFQILNWWILEDLRKVIKLRGFIAEGHRELFLFMMMNYLALSGQVEPENFFQEVLCVAAEIDPRFECSPSSVNTVYDKLLASRRGEKVEFNGKKYSPLYTPKMATLVDMLGITDDEQRQLKVIHCEHIRREIKAEQVREKRREKGAIPREEYEARSVARKEQALALRDQGKTERAIAIEMGLSQSQIHRYLKS